MSNAHHPSTSSHAGADRPPVLELVDAAIPSLRERFTAVLSDVNWTVRAGEFWAVAGLAHSGKTNLLNVAAGVMRPQRGRYELFGREFSGGFEDDHLLLRLKVGLVFDGGQLLHHITMRENIELPLLWHAGRATQQDEIESRVEKLIDFVELGHRTSQSPTRVTRSWQQRAGLARALALKPEVLLLDNPLSGLDPIDAAWWLDTLDELAAGHPIIDGRPLTIAVAADDLRPWLSRASHFAILKGPSFMPLGGRETLEQQTEPLVRDLLRSRPSGS